MRSIGVIAVVLAGLSGCARDSFSLQWDATAAQAERFYLQGDYHQALESFNLLRETARVDKDRYFVVMRAGDCFWKLDEYAEARRAYYDSTGFAKNEEEVAKSMFRASRAIYEQDAEQGVAAFIKVLRKYPETLWAQRSVDYVTAHYDSLPDADSSLISVYKKALPGVKGSVVEGYVQFQLAGRLGRDENTLSLEEAVRLYDQIVHNDKAQGLWDDALYEKSQALARLKRFAEELDVHRKILQSRTEAYLFGNYETTYYHRSQYRIAELLLGPLQQRSAGIAALRTFVEEFSYSRKYDDALYLLAVYLFEDGQQNEARRVLDRLVKERPESRYVRRVEALKKTGKDPGPSQPWSSRTDLEGLE